MESEMEYGFQIVLCLNLIATERDSDIQSKIYIVLENYLALLWWKFQSGKFLREKATII